MGRAGGHMTLPCYHSLLTPDRVYTALPPAHRRPNPKPSMQPYGHVTRPLPPNRSVGRTLWYSPIVHHKDSTACNFHLSNPVTGVYRSYTPGWGFLSWDLLDAAATRSSAVAALRGTAVPRCTSLCSGSLRVSVFFSFFLSFLPPAKCITQYMAARQKCAGAGGLGDTLR